MALKFAPATLLIGTLFLCNCQAPTPPPREVSSPFKSYWYNGEAELSRYALSQSRYGQNRTGDAVLIYVTEDFLSGPQVKNENRAENEKSVSVLKLNFTKKFMTGIYPYSLMTSVFSPVESTQLSLKVSASAQEWCGHAYSQINYRDGQYQGELHSYFEQEADQSFEVATEWLEDDIWTRIRLNPAELPLGTIQMLPGAEYLRLSHQPFTLQTATISMDSVALQEGNSIVYTIAYKNTARSLEITFDQAFPHLITSWEETFTTGGEQRVTTAQRTHTYRSPYWQQNALKDSVMRDKLGLPVR